MESLLKMSGLLTDEEAGKTDLGTLEKRLAEKVTTNGSPLLQDKAPASGTSSTVHPSESNGSTPQRETQSPRTATTSPGVDAEKEKKAEVENLSDMMCSLVTNNCGETRYIGKNALVFDVQNADYFRLIFRLLNLLAQRN